MSVPFEPIGGFPPIVRTEESDINKKTLESRGFATTNIVSISNIMDTKKKENLFTAFGFEEEDGGIDLLIEGMFTETAPKYDDIVYKDIPKKLSSNKKQSSRSNE